MKNLVCRSLVLLSFLLVLTTGFAFAQSNALNIPGVDLVGWGGSLLAFAGALTILTQAIKTRLKKRLEHVPHIVVQGITVAAGIGISYGIDSQGLLIDPMFAGFPGPWNWVAYGSLAGIASIGAYDLLATFLGKSGTQPTGFDPAALPQTPEDLLAIVTNSSIAVDIRRRAVEALKMLSPVAGAAAEIALEQLLTRPLTVTEGKTARDAEAESRAAQNPKVLTDG